MASLKMTDMLLIKDVFETKPGYVLDFSDRTFSDFFNIELDINIDEPYYSQSGGSKGKRFRFLLQNVEDVIAAKVLRGLWEYREALRARSGQQEDVPNAKSQLEKLIQRLEGRTSTDEKQSVQPDTHENKARLSELGGELINLSRLEPQHRGYVFEAFLTKVWNAYGLTARESFRLRGEQIDGSFILHNELYLLEAKWQNHKSGVSELHAFHGKVDTKAAWTRGLFISQCGFSEDGLYAFGKGKKVICMDGLDLYLTLNEGLALEEVLDRKVRHAAETGDAFTSVKSLFAL